MESLRAAETVEAMAAAAREAGAGLSDEEASRIWNALHHDSEEGEISDEELESVSGGCGSGREGSCPGCGAGGPGSVEVKTGWVEGPTGIQGEAMYAQCVKCGTKYKFWWQ